MSVAALFPVPYILYPIKPLCTPFYFKTEITMALLRVKKWSYKIYFQSKFRRRSTLAELPSKVGTNPSPPPFSYRFTCHPPYLSTQQTIHVSSNGNSNEKVLRQFSQFLAVSRISVSTSLYLSTHHQSFPCWSWLRLLDLYMTFLACLFFLIFCHSTHVVPPFQQFFLNCLQWRIRGVNESSCGPSSSIVMGIFFLC